MDQLATVDRFSALPWEILDNILGRLPVTDVVRTSVLSKKWRDKWVDLSKLVFDDSSGATVFKDEDKFVKFVYHVLLSHRGQISKFMISTKSIPDKDCLDDWILFLSRNDIMDLILESKEFGPHGMYVFPSGLFSCQKLKHLYLTDCDVVLPPRTNGFPNLVSLALMRFWADDNELEHLIRSCPNLERLALSWIVMEFGRLKICAPKLKSLYLEGEFYVYLENSPHLTDGSFRMNLKLLLDEEMQIAAYGLFGPSCCQPHFERLVLSGRLIKFLPAVQMACDRLKVLELYDVEFYELDEMRAIIYILSSSSNLKELRISVSTPFRKNVYDFLKAQFRSTCCFNQLRVVRINIYAEVEEEEIEEQRSDLELIKLLLARSPILEKMFVNLTDPEGYDRWFMGKLLSFQRASKELTLKFSFSTS
ncbi:hypothetical protein RJ640_026708 [Escallonia rubra]|uniref:F-box domain-containing protein n=1 Tax=Escallonia rubra TaxID=112253 RepID=A0AA88QJL0_9ASTE|nr:hypothetical protein RJ640_026708 [Escallonia rubra]